MPQEKTSRMRHHNTTHLLDSSSIPSLRNEFTELECYLTKEYEDLKSLWLDLNEQHAKAKSEEEVLVQMLKEKRTTENSQDSSLDDNTNNLMQVNTDEIENETSTLGNSPSSEYNESVIQKPLVKAGAGNDITNSFDLLTLSSPNISETGESEFQNGTLTEKSSEFNIKDNLNNALRKLQKLDEEDYDISQDEEMTDIISIESKTLPIHESDDDHEIIDDIGDDEWSEDKTRLALKDMLDMMRDQNS
ncbi:unnamed protein product [Rhizophagus irregularis]|uniref:Uncharacterized protein n=1 Tax=Rhizophagus irregularis TaxID=588596 RepID=A0A2I1GID7_9GLOM|nr:hypothetical protein RhiirA4_543288 [Rhizophagus irregularis]CAB4420251.1 unnamed protein product [Rhizophagus irregularis]